MKISSISSEKPFFPSFPEQKTFLLPPSYLSTIREGRKASTNIFSWLWGKINQFFSWILSWVYYPKGEQKIDRFFKVETDGKIHYRIQDSENEVHLGPRVARLENISMPDKEELESLPEMFAHVMETESIDMISTTNFYLASLLWKAELKTKNSCHFFLQGSDPFSQFVSKLLQEAFQRRDDNDLSVEFDNVLKKIEKQFVLGILSSTLDCQGIRKPVDAYYHPKKIGEEFVFDEQKARSQLNILEDALGADIDIESLENEFSDERTKSALQKLRVRKRKRLRISDDPFVVSISLNTLFQLMHKMNKEVQRAQTFSISPIMFAKG